MAAGEGLVVAPLRQRVGKFLPLALFEHHGHPLARQARQALLAVALDLVKAGNVKKAVSDGIDLACDLPFLVGDLHLAL